MNKVSVFINFGFQPILVGTLIENRQKVYFQFDTDFLYLNLDLSPFKLKKQVILLNVQLHLLMVLVVYSMIHCQMVGDICCLTVC